MEKRGIDRKSYLCLRSGEDREQRFTLPGGFPKENKDWIRHIYVKTVQDMPQVTAIDPIDK